MGVFIPGFHLTSAPSEWDNLTLRIWVYESTDGCGEIVPAGQQACRGPITHVVVSSKRIVVGSKRFVVGPRHVMQGRIRGLLFPDYGTMVI